jgi:hypothetical protein
MNTEEEIMKLRERIAVLEQQPKSYPPLLQPLAPPPQYPGQTTYPFVSGISPAVGINSGPVPNLGTQTYC